MKFFEIVPPTVNINFVGARFMALVISGIAVIAALVVIFAMGFNYGIDFAGGLEMRVEFTGTAGDVTIGDVRDIMNDLPEDMPLSGVQVNSFIIPGKNVYTIKAKGEENVERVGGDVALQDLSTKLHYYLASLYADRINVHIDLVQPKTPTSLAGVRQAVNELTATMALSDVEVREARGDDDKIMPNQFVVSAKLPAGNVEQGRHAVYQLPLTLPPKIDEVYGENVTNVESVNHGEEAVNIVSTDMVGPRVGATLRKKGLNAILYALIGILVYVGWRFNFRYSPGGVVALAHDVIITAGIFALLQREISLVVIAALLTIAGYSINDTIVVYDRIREGLEKKYRNKPLDEAVNRSINETLSRTLLTSLTTLIVVISLFVLGGEILHDFALALLIGILIGTYSSVFIASPIYLVLEEWFSKRRRAKGATR